MASLRSAAGITKHPTIYTEIWGCNRNLEGVEQAQLRALRMFFGVGKLHPKVSLLAEMRDLPMFTWASGI